MPLRGTTVVEFGNLIAAPYAGMLLADLGARVIKVEPPGGDLGRRFGPFRNGESVFFMAVNRGKESLALDTKDWVSKRILDNLVRRADVVINNLRRGAMDRMGLDEERVRRLNPSVVYGVVSAFGAEGPYADRAGVDIIFQGESGMISITGEPKDRPHKTATTIGDYLAGTNLALGVTAAMVRAPRTGCRVDISLRDGLMAVQSGWNALAFTNGEQPVRTGTASPYLAPNQVFQASDGPLTLAVVSDRHFEILADALGLPELVSRFPTNEARMENRARVQRTLNEVFGSAPAEHWVDLLSRAGLPVGRVLDLTEALGDPQARHNEMTFVVDHPVAGPITLTGSPTMVDRVPARSERPPATLGQHTRPILSELGVDEGTIDRMVESGTAIVS